MTSETPSRTKIAPQSYCSYFSYFSLLRSRGVAESERGIWGLRLALSICYDISVIGLLANLYALLAIQAFFWLQNLSLVDEGVFGLGSRLDPVYMRLVSFYTKYNHSDPLETAEIQGCNGTLHHERIPESK